MKTRLVFLLTVTLLAVQSASACLWDKDTLAAETVGKASVLEAIIGRFDVYPPKYYEMRLERVTKEVLEKPAELSLYDDAGVACDRLGRGDEAIDWMARKKAELDKLSADTPGLTDQRYRYLANLGTFHAHRWLKHGADRSDLSELKQARDLIAEAIAVNPGAHFGREKYQLEALEWLIDPPPGEGKYFSSGGKDKESINDFMVDQTLPIMIRSMTSLRKEAGLQPGDENRLMSRVYGEAMEGFAGLITLGAGAESVDLHYTIAVLAQLDARSSLAQIASLRTMELVEEGKKSLHPQAAHLNQEELRKVTRLRLNRLEENRLAEVETWYSSARQAATEWRANRNAYLERMMDEGKHPDTHPEILKGMPDIPPMPTQPDKKLSYWMEDNSGAVVVIVFSVLLLAVYVFARVQQRRRTRQAQAAVRTVGR